MLGDFQQSSFGIETSFLNYILYFLFIAVMGIIILNLFVGIAVGEISRTLDEADIKQISLRIVYVLKVQDAVQLIRKVPCFKNSFNMRYDAYCYATFESQLVKSFYKVFNFVKLKLIRSPEINLVDPQRRLEDLINDLSEHSSNNHKAIKDSLD